ncbi:MAG: hypothetical protein U0822_12780 [Anaerolineae bacterium]
MLIALLLQIHSRLPYVLMGYMAVMAVWGLWLYFRRLPFNPGYFFSLALGIVLIAAQALLGLTLLVTGLRAAQLIHYLYGALALLALPIAYLYLQSTQWRRGMLIIGLVCAIVIALVWRGMATALQ